MRAFLIGLVLAPLLCATGLSQVVQVKPKKGSVESGVIRSEDGDRIEINVYRTKVADVTHGTKTLELGGKAAVIPHEPVEVSFLREVRALREKKAKPQAWIDLGEKWNAAKRPDLGEQALAEGLAAHPTAPLIQAALKRELEEVMARDPRLATGLRDLLAALEQANDFAERSGILDDHKDLAKAWPRHWIERVIRSKALGTGRTDRVPLTLRASEAPGATYCRFVSSKYDPAVPTPLVIALHGGGRAGKNRNRVAGFGEETMPFYADHAEKSGWIVVCPSALQAPWGQAANAPFIEALVDECAILFNVDRNRIYLVGHSMGGYGTWHYGPLFADRWAAIGPAAGGGRPNLKRLQDSKTAVYLHHGADDQVVSVGPDRALGEQMRSRDMDFIYCEMPNSGHGFPRSVRKELWDFLDLRRLAIKKGRAYRTMTTADSSFLEVPSRDEILYFDDPRREPEEPSFKELAKRLALGGPRSSGAAEGLAASGQRKALSVLSKCLNPKRNNFDVRRSAALALGQLGDARAIKPLLKALRDEELLVIAAAAESLGQLGGKSGGQHMELAAAQLEAAIADADHGGWWEHEDFIVLVQLAQGVARGAGALENEAAAPTLERVEKALMGGLKIPTIGRVTYDAAPHIRRLGLDLIAAAKATGPAAQPLLDRLASHRDAKVAAAARKARS